MSLDVFPPRASTSGGAAVIKGQRITGSWDETPAGYHLVDGAGAQGCDPGDAVSQPSGIYPYATGGMERCDRLNQLTNAASNGDSNFVARGRFNRGAYAISSTTGSATAQLHFDGDPALGVSRRANDSSKWQVSLPALRSLYAVAVDAATSTAALIRYVAFYAATDGQLFLSTRTLDTATGTDTEIGSLPVPKTGNLQWGPYQSPWVSGLVGGHLVCAQQVAIDLTTGTPYDLPWYGYPVAFEGNKVLYGAAGGSSNRRRPLSVSTVAIVDHALVLGPASPARHAVQLEDSGGTPQGVCAWLGDRWLVMDMVGGTLIAPDGTTRKAFAPHPLLEYPGYPIWYVLSPDPLNAPTELFFGLRIPNGGSGQPTPEYASWWGAHLPASVHVGELMALYQQTIEKD